MKFKISDFEQIPSDLSTETAQSVSFDLDSFVSTHSDTLIDFNENSLESDTDSQIEQSDLRENTSNLANQPQDIQASISNLAIQNDIMAPGDAQAQTKADFMRLAGPILNYKYVFITVVIHLNWKHF